MKCNVVNAIHKQMKLRILIQIKPQKTAKLLNSTQVNHRVLVTDLMRKQVSGGNQVTLKLYCLLL